jgi:biopolymer transport protein ExbD
MKRTFFNGKKQKKEIMDLDITSLLDVLVILLVFLLKSYNASNLKLNLVKDLIVPSSAARTMGEHAVIVQVDQNKNLYVNNKQIGMITRSGESPILLQHLKSIKENSDIAEVKAAKRINLVFDEGIPYKVMKGVMHTSALVGYTEFKFIVQGNY